MPIVQSVDNTGLLTLFFPIKLTQVNQTLYDAASETLSLSLVKKVPAYNTAVISWLITSYMTNTV